MKKLFSLALIFLFTVSLQAQKLGLNYLPHPDKDSPSWIQMLYKTDINANELRDAYDNYYKMHSFEKTVYTQYYKRWMKMNDAYIQEDGSINNEEPKPSSVRKKYRGPNSEWSVIGPLETFYPNWDNTAQPPVPWQVNIYALDIAPSNTNIIYACPETGGIFKSIDKGQNWFSVSDTIKLGAMTAIAVHPTNANIVYAGGNSTIYKSSNGGDSWNVVYTQTNFSCNDIAIKSDNPSIIFAAGSNAFITSVNDGASWNQVGNLTGSTYDIEVNSANPNSMYILRKPLGDTAVRFYRSTDGGQNFNLINTGWTSTLASSGRMTVTAADTNFIYAVLLMAGNVDAPNVLRSIDGGNTWSLMCTGITNSLTGNTTMPLGMSNGQGYYDLSIMASTQNPGEVIVGTTTAYKSIDSGNTFNRIGGYGGVLPIHPDIQEMKMIGNDAWIATDGGLNYSTDFFDAIGNLSARNRGIYGSDFWGFGQGWNEDFLCGGRYHNGNTGLHDNYPSGQALRLGGGEAGTGYTMVGREGYVAHSDIGTNILPKNFSGPTGSFAFSIYPNEDNYGFNASEVEFYPSCYNHIYIGKDSSLWKSIDGGASYVEVYDFNERVKKFEISRSNPDVIYLATHSNFYRTSDEGATWSVITRPSGTSINRMAITVSHVDENVLWICSRYNTNVNSVF